MSASKQRITLDASRRFQNTYGGMFDLVNVSKFDQDDLKFAALAHERIIVHDGYFFLLWATFRPSHSIAQPVASRTCYRSRYAVSAEGRSGSRDPAWRFDARYLESRL